MPTRPPSVCAEPGCSSLTDRYRCAEHTVRVTRTSTMYGTKRWRIVRARHLLHSPWCVTCGRLATDVDHIVALRDGGDPWSADNRQSMCRSCHARKTAHEVGLGHR